MAYFCDGCLEFWKNKKFMDGCKECGEMEQNWGKTSEEAAERVLELWGPIVTWCKENNTKAWVKQPNAYSKRLPFTGIKVALPAAKTPFWEQQREFARLYNNSPSQEYWDILHPETQCQLQLRI